MTNALATVEQREAHPLVLGIQARMPAIRSMLPPGMDPERFMAVTVMAIVKNPDILACTAESVIAAVIEAAQDGLEPTGARGGAHLVKFGNEAVLIRDYRGVIRIIIESRAASRVDARPVRHGDVFALDYASPDPVTHKPLIPPTGEVYGYYALFWLPDGTKQAEFMTVADIENTRAQSRGKDSLGWTKFFDQMARKTVIKRGANYLNLRPDIRERLMREDQAEFEGQIISVQRDERLAESRSRIHDRAARLTGGAANPDQPPAGETASVAQARAGQPDASSTTPPAASTRPADAPPCRHLQKDHQNTEQGIVCGACGTVLAQRDQPAASVAGDGAAPVARGGGEGSGSSSAANHSVQSEAASPPGGSSPAPAPTTMPDAQSRVGALAIQHRLVGRIQTDQDWDAFDAVLRARGMEPPPLEASPEAIAEWNALGDRIGLGEFDASPGTVSDDPMGRCQAHDLPWKHVEAGHSTRTGKDFNAFWCCPATNCKNRPTTAWRDAQKAGAA